MRQRKRIGTLEEDKYPKESKYEEDKEQLFEVRIKLARVVHILPSVKIKSAQLRNGEARFYANTGAEVSTIRQDSFNIGAKIDSRYRVAILGVTHGARKTVGTIKAQLQGLECTLHVVPTTSRLMRKES